MTWAVLYDLAAQDVHVIPCDDLISHDLHDGCVCQPTPELVVAADGDAWVQVHHSLDGREQTEEKRA